MKKLIIFASKSGTTEKCACMLKEKLSDAEIVSLKEMKDKKETDYDILIFGSYIRMGMMDKSLKKYLLENAEELKKKKVFLFICCGFEENKKQYFTNNIPSDLLNAFVYYESFGGELNIEKTKGIDKLIVKMVRKSSPDRVVKLNEENINKFLSKINEVKN